MSPVFLWIQQQEKIWEPLPNFIPGAGGQHETPWFPPKGGKRPCQGALGGMEGGKAGLGLGMVPARHLLSRWFLGLGLDSGSSLRQEEAHRMESDSEQGR